MTPRLGVNIDHVATIRQARGGRDPDPVWAAVLCELAGADGITVHLREDRRHIQDRDLHVLRESVKVRLNLELAAEPEIVAIALAIRPDQVTFVPERREELTTEGGLDVIGQRARVEAAVQRCLEAGLAVSLFIDPDPDQVEASARMGAEAVELHTGKYADAKSAADHDLELAQILRASDAVRKAGLKLHAGHGLNYQNVAEIARIDKMIELNIGHSIVSRAVFVGMDCAVREMRSCIISAAAGERR